MYQVFNNIFMDYKYCACVIYSNGNFSWNVFDDKNKPFILNDEQRKKVNNATWKQIFFLRSNWWLKEPDSFNIYFNENFKVIK